MFEPGFWSKLVSPRLLSDLQGGACWPEPVNSVAGLRRSRGSRSQTIRQAQRCTSNRLLHCYSSEIGWTDPAPGQRAQKYPLSHDHLRNRRLRLVTPGFFSSSKLVDDSRLPADVFLYSASKVSETEETHHEQSRPFLEASPPPLS